MASDKSDMFCQGLPSTPVPSRGTVLVTGTTGYIGGRLVPELAARGYRVRAMVRAAASTPFVSTMSSTSGALKTSYLTGDCSSGPK